MRSTAAPAPAITTAALVIFSSPPSPRRMPRYEPQSRNVVVVEVEHQAVVPAANGIGHGLGQVVVLLPVEIAP